MRLDRQLQLAILQAAAAVHPNAEVEFLKSDSPEFPNSQRISHALYLEKHGLLESGLTEYQDGGFHIGEMKITAAGLDFLDADGGLSATLGVVTIKLHEKDLLALIGSRIESSALPPTDKKKLLDGLRSLPAESIKHLTMKLLDKGLENLPVALPLIQTYLMTHLK
jgi:hypothetical protein